MPSSFDVGAMLVAAALDERLFHVVRLDEFADPGGEPGGHRHRLHDLLAAVGVILRLDRPRR